MFNCLLTCSDYFCCLVLSCEGAIELSILADYYGREIAAYDIQTMRCDLYGQVSAINNFVFFKYHQLEHY